MTTEAASDDPWPPAGAIDAPRATTENARIEQELLRLNAELSQQALELKEANRTLLDSEQRLRLALETGRIGLWVWNSTDVANAGDWSPRLKEIFGLPLNSEVTHEMFLDCVHPEDRTYVHESVMQALGGKDGGKYQAEYRAIRSHDGVERWVTARGQAFFDAQGQAFRFLGTIMDITERKLAEQMVAQSNLDLEQRIALRTADLERANEALRRSEDDLRQAIDTIPGLVWTAQPNGIVDYHNKRWLDYTGLAQEQANGWQWQQAIHPDDLAGLAGRWKTLLASGEAGEHEARLRRFDGIYRWFIFRGVPLFDDQGELVKWYGTNTDVDDHHAAEHVARGHLGVLTHMLDILGQESDPDQLAKHVVNTVKTQLGAASVTVWERNGDRLDLLGINEEGSFRTRDDAGYFEGSIPVRGPAPPLWIEALETGDHILVEDIDQEPTRILLADGRTALWRESDLTRPFAELKEHLVAQKVRSLLICPLRLAGRLAGIIGIRFQGTRIFGREEIDLAKALAHQAMLAMQMMHLSQQSRQSAVLGERNRLARDIHDTLAQGFTGIIIQLEAAEDARSRGLCPEADIHLARARELARDSLQEARRSVHALRPQALDRQDLCGAMSELLQKMTEGTTLRARFSLEGKPASLPPEWEDNLLRICQEALTNTLRHAVATQFSCLLIFAPHAVHLRLRDDGHGFDDEAGHDGFGLVGMKERVETMHGELTLQSSPDRGTLLHVQLPLTAFKAYSGR